MSSRLPAPKSAVAEGLNIVMLVAAAAEWRMKIPLYMLPPMGKRLAFKSRLDVVLKLVFVGAKSSLLSIIFLIFLIKRCSKILPAAQTIES